MLNENTLKNIIIDSTEGKEPDVVWESMIQAIEGYLNENAKVNMVFSGTLGNSPSPLNGPHTFNLITSLDADYIKQTTKITGGMIGLPISLTAQLMMSRPEHNTSNTISILAPYPILTLMVAINTFGLQRDQAMLAIATGIINGLRSAVMVPPILSAPVNVVAAGSAGALTFVGII